MPKMEDPLAPLLVIRACALERKDSVDWPSATHYKMNLL
jgi:hypothetical protein